jgi:hypothetical protein
LPTIARRARRTSAAPATSDELSEWERYYNQGVNRLWQPVGLFGWVQKKTCLHEVGIVRSDDALKIHCWGKLILVYLLLLLNP